MTAATKPPSSSPGTGAAGPSLALWLALFFVGAHVLSFRGSGPVDDELIFWRYADHWVHGKGLAFNPGQVVEGFSAPGWLLWIAGGMKLGLSPELTTFTGALLGALAAVYGTALAWRSIHPRTRWCPPAFLVAASPALAWHAVAGLGTAPMAGLIAVWLGAWLAAWRVGRPPWLAAAALGLAALMRAEALVFALPFLLVETRRRRVAGAAAGLVAFTPALAWLGFRLATFGRWLPVTYYVKRLPWLEDLRFGTVYLALSTATTGIGILALLAVPLFMRRYVPPRAASGGPREPANLQLPLRAAAVGLLTHVAYVVHVGGDFMELARFFVPSLPVAIVLAAAGLERLTESRAPAAARAIQASAFGLLLIASQAPQLPGRERPALAARHAQFEARWSRVGTELRRRAVPGTRVALAPIGALGWTSGLEIIDLLGLTNDELWRYEPDLSIVDKGHHRFDAEWTLAQRPDLVILANGWMPTDEDGNRTMVISAWEGGLYGHPEFQAGYVPMLLELPGEDPVVIHVRRGHPPPTGCKPL